MELLKQSEAACKQSRTIALLAVLAISDSNLNRRTSFENAAANIFTVYPEGIWCFKLDLNYISASPFDFTIRCT